MDNSTGISKMAGRAGSLFALVGILTFFAGVFGAPRTFLFVGLALIVLALASYAFEEFGPRR